jgi:hypothetical protein
MHESTAREAWHCACSRSAFLCVIRENGLECVSCISVERKEVVGPGKSAGSIDL